MELCTKLNYIPTEQDAKAKTINEVRCHMSTGTPNGKAEPGPRTVRSLGYLSGRVLGFDALSRYGGSNADVRSQERAHWSVQNNYPCW